MLNEYEYDVCLSFAGEQRYFVEAVAEGLRKVGIRVFYDGYERAALWGKDLYTSQLGVWTRGSLLCPVRVS